ncbi:hypothetical protein EV368DRAFT_65244 [Lentinula lateritia]|nr:hypothetical protein EV368DRAFT_65244 [Lentinula lateritia]
MRHRYTLLTPLLLQLLGSRLVEHTIPRHWWNHAQPILIDPDPPGFTAPTYPFKTTSLGFPSSGFKYLISFPNMKNDMYTPAYPHVEIQMVIGRSTMSMGCDFSILFYIYLGDRYFPESTSRERRVYSRVPTPAVNISE